MSDDTSGARGTRHLPGWLLAVAGLACATGLIAVPAAGAAAPPSTRTEHVGGYLVQWPSNAALGLLRPGDGVQASLIPSAKARRLGRVAVVTLARVTRSGVAVHLVARRSLRSGTFSTRLPAGSTGRYRLRVVVGRAYSQVTFVVGPQPPTASGPCDAGDEANAELGLSADSAAPGDALKITLTNAGPGCLTAGYGFDWQVSRGGVWTDVPLHLAVPAIALLLAPGQMLTEAFTVPTDSPPGQYRIVKHFRGAGDDLEADDEVTVAP
ncbi:MAG TPA: immunoglobulin-like domain-containing protein [Solirubrobacteraceae bacterium]|jgi:hypothetical protein|nr:immunoglobulin-like domain-containing protein [Solirubrobacteraceae bacterium]